MHCCITITYLFYDLIVWYCQPLAMRERVWEQPYTGLVQQGYRCVGRAYLYMNMCWEWKIQNAIVICIGVVIKKDIVLTLSTHVMEVKRTAVVTTTSSSSKEMTIITSLKRTNKL